jgi:hypothetical protein
MSRTRIFALVIAAAGCNSPVKIDHGHPPGGGPMTNPTGADLGSSGVGGNGPSVDAGAPPPTCTVTDPSKDMDGDGYTPAGGDCNDCDPLINPGAVNIPGDPISYDCSGNNNPPASCDTANTGKNDPTSLTQSIELCDKRFVKSSMMNGPSDTRARNVMANFGILKPQKGANMMLLSNGIAVDEMGAGFVNPQSGTVLSDTNTFANPLPNLMGASGCGQSGAVDTVNDYTELVIQLKAPTNAKSFSFSFQFFSGEYPDFVCTQYNDEFLAVVQSSKTYPQPTNISFDAMKNPITVNSGFFIVCNNGLTPQTKHCTQPPSNNNGTGYEIPLDPITAIPGGSTGWLTTTAPIMPGEDITLRFVIFDEGDHQLDSAVLIDNFQWAVQATKGGPVTGPITRVIRHRAPGASLMCGGA